MQVITVSIKELLASAESTPAPVMLNPTRIGGIMALMRTKPPSQRGGSDDPIVHRINSDMLVFTVLTGLSAHSHLL